MPRHDTAWHSTARPCTAKLLAPATGCNAARSGMVHRQLTTATPYKGDGLVIPPDRLQLVNWTFPEEAPEFVSLADHCAYRQLLHLPGNSYAGAVCLGIGCC